MNDDQENNHLHHSWYDAPEWEHWGELEKAQEYVSEYVYKWSRCRLICKEKYGTIRYEYMFPPGGRMFNVSSIKIPFMTMNVDFIDNKLKKTYYWGDKGFQKVIIWRWVDSWLYRKWTVFGWWVLGKAVKSAQNKFPNVKQEIIDDLTWKAN
jgi:hypothetical protein